MPDVLERDIIRSVALPLRQVTLIDGQSCPITNMLDLDGDDTADWREAFRIVVGPTRDGKWIAALTTPDERNAEALPN
jgi:hypothetical protein